MKKNFLCLGIVSLLSLFAHAIETPKTFDGAIPQPYGTTDNPISQLKIKFPSTINKSRNGTKEVFTVSCLPEVQGYSSWANNDTIWTYNFKAPDEYSSPLISGGSKCNISQTEDIVADDGKIWKAGSITYTVIINGPTVDSVYAAAGFQETLREKEPVILIAFNGPVDRTRFFSEQNGYLSYLSANAPREKIPLTAIPKDQEEKVFSHFAANRYFDLNYKDNNWILATVKQNLIPGAQVNLSIENQASSINRDIHANKKFNKEFSVRSEFQAKIECANPSAKDATCLPHSSISIKMNGHAKWMDVKKSYIEYLPYKSTDGKLVKSYPELNQDVSLWESFLNTLADYFPFLAKYSDTIVDSATFNVNIEPETQAKIVLPAGLKDIDDRILSNAIAEFHIRIGTMEEVIHTPQPISVFEKNVPNLYLPVGIVNLNQKISIRKTGTEANKWEPIQEAPTIINLIRAYQNRGSYRKDELYISPLQDLKISNNVIEQQLTGTKNRPNYLQFPFAQKGEKPKSGFYAIEVSSPTYESNRSNGEEKSFYNPKYVLAQVTDLAVHLKKGATKTLIWVTHLSNGAPAANAEIQIYNCLAQQVQTLQANASGLATLENQKWAENCNRSENSWSPYFAEDAFYVFAKTDSDQTVTHSSWTSPGTYALSAPGVDWYYSSITENRPHFHSVIGVNLVKPGQQVPIQFIAKTPLSNGFNEVSENELPTLAQIASADDSDIYYELPLKWKNGMADIVWNVPNDDSVRLGRYTIQLAKAPNGSNYYVSSGEIEVAEFKVPLMSGLISFPKQNLVQPDSVPVNTTIRYANGVGAKKLNTELSYYFEPTLLSAKDFANFIFGSGAVKLSADESNEAKLALPRHTRPATITGLETNADGSLVKDIAQEKTADGKTISEILKQSDHPEKLVVRIRYQDQMGEYQTLSQAKDIFNSFEYIGTQLVSGNRNQARVKVVVLNVDQKNITNTESLDLKLFKIETKVIGEELYGGLIKNTLEREIKPVRWQKACSIEDQILSCRMDSLKAGNYAFQVNSKRSKQAANTLFKIDSDGRVYGPNDYYNFGDDEGQKQMPLGLNKKTYKEGEKAVISFSPPFKTCYALVTLERSEVMQHWLVANACEKGFVEVPVTATLAPNAFVSIYAITGRAESASFHPGEIDLGRPTYRLGFANMKVNWDRYKSNVTVKIEKEKYEPGETVNGEIFVKPQTGTLSNGTVTLVALEEKILELKPNDTYKILEAFMDLRGHEVETVTPLEKVETVTANNSELPDDSSRKGGDEGGDGNSKSEFKRKLFNALVSFQPGLRLVNGVVKFSFKTNDSLTKFRIFAIASDSSQKFGTGEIAYLTEKDTQIYSNIPSLARTGDNYPLKVTLQNNSSKNSKFKAEAQVTIKDSHGKIISQKTLTKEFSADHSSSKTVDIGNISVNDEAGSIEYVINVYDENGNIVDALQPEAQTILPSQPLALQTSFIGQMENEKFSHTLEKELAALKGKGEIRISVTNSLVTGALKQIQQRVAQDKFADFFMESQFYKVLLNSTESKHEELKNILTLLLSYTDSEGFLKYYPQANRGSIWFTASVINALQQEPWSLKLIPSALSEKWKGAVSKVLSRTVSPVYIGKGPMNWLQAQAVMGRSAFAFKDAKLQTAAKALSENVITELQRNPSVYGETIDKWSNGDLINVWLLQVFATPQVAPTSPLLTQLLSPSRLVYSGNMAQLNGAPKYKDFYSDETIETAQFLLGHALIHGEKNRAWNFALGLLNLNKNGWYNTATMMAVNQGLKAFGRSYEAEAVTGTSLMSVPEQQASVTMDWNKMLSFDFRIPWTVNTATVQITHSGTGKPWIGIQGLSAVPLDSARGQGISIEKQIRNITNNTGFQAGDVIEVELIIHASDDLNNVALQDPIPAGSNILSEAYGSYSSGQKSYSGYKLYFDNLPKGMTTVKYQYQLNNPGTFNLPPTHAEALYMPSLFADMPNKAMTVK
ncbi:MAG: alpha-2-macroglobulin family protein [Bdellovibrio sp.]